MRINKKNNNYNHNPEIIKTKIIQKLIIHQNIYLQKQKIQYK